MTTEKVADVVAAGFAICTNYDVIGAGHAAQPIRGLLNRITAAHQREMAHFRLIEQEHGWQVLAANQRAETAEAELARLRDALRKIANATAPGMLGVVNDSWLYQAAIDALATQEPPRE